MRRNQERFLWLGVSILGALIWSPVLTSQDSVAKAGIPLTTDWSHQHVVFSKPGTEEQARRVQQDVRYWQQLNRQAFTKLQEIGSNSADVSEWHPDAIPVSYIPNGKVKGDWAESMGSGAKLGARNYPAKFSFSLTTANCASAAQPDFVVYSTGLAGSGTQASIVAYDNLYSGCTGTVPTIYWAYNTGGQILTSPVFSTDGTQVAFVQTLAGQASLVLLKWAASTSETITSPMLLTPVLTSAYLACTAPCMTAIALTSGTGAADDDTGSSFYYVYTNDSAFVGDNSGWVHQFTAVFLGTPTEVRTGGWPVQVNSGKPLSDPVHDYSSGNLFVGDTLGFLYRINSSASVTKSGQLDFGVGLVQGPYIDSTQGLVYAFASSDGSGACTGGANCAAVYQLSTNFLSTEVGSEAVVGNSTVTGSAPNPLYLGAFDSTYQNSDTATGNIYVCGNTGGAPTLYKVAVASRSFGVVTAGPVLSSSTTPCSPVSDIQNPNVPGGATEWIFASAETGGTSTACAAAGCIYNFKDTPWKASTSYSVGQEVVDTHFQVQVVTKAGTSGTVTPGWQTIDGKVTTDGTVHWLDQGLQTAVTPATWVKNHGYALRSKVLDINNNVQLVTKAGTSGATIPTFNATAGKTTVDGTVTWTNAGALATAAVVVSGGASGTIGDNTVETLTGASQIYFSTLGNQVCGTSGTGGCAIQASQAALK